MVSNSLLTAILQNTVFNSHNTVLFNHLYITHVLSDWQVYCPSPEAIQKSIKIIQENDQSNRVVPDLDEEDLTLYFMCTLSFLIGLNVGGELILLIHR